VNISNLIKQKDEKVLVETLSEAFMFPVKNTATGETYHFLGEGQQAIKDGEVFRAIINGKNLKL
jgi:hypothetical protein